MKLFKILFLFTFVILFPGIEKSFSQSSSFFNQRDDQYRLLGLKRAKDAYEIAKNEYLRNQELYNQNMISLTELEQIKSMYNEAEVNYQQSLLAVLFERQHVTINSAVKKQLDNGNRLVVIEIANASQGGAEFMKLINIDDRFYKFLQPNIINNVYVSILDDNGSIISKPYEIKIEELIYGKPKKIEFVLLKDLDDITVSLIYGSGSQRIMKIALEKDTSTNKIEVESDQFSQIVDLGSSVSYDLNFELFGGAEKVYTLYLVNLPSQLSYTFKDPVSGALLNQIKFNKANSTKKATLLINIPSYLDHNISVNDQISFYALAIPSDLTKSFLEGSEKIWTRDDFEKLNLGYTNLKLIMRGKGKFLIRPNQYFYTNSSNDITKITLSLTNEGSTNIDNINFQVELPQNWKKDIDPVEISKLESLKDTLINIQVIPSENVVAGRYEVRIRTSGQSRGLPIVGEDKVIIIEIEQPYNFISTILIIFVIILLTGTIVIYTTKIAKK